MQVFDHRRAQFTEAFLATIPKLPPCQELPIHQAEALVPIARRVGLEEAAEILGRLVMAVKLSACPSLTTSHPLGRGYSPQNSQPDYNDILPASVSDQIGSHPTTRWPDVSQMHALSALADRLGLRDVSQWLTSVAPPPPVRPTKRDQRQKRKT